MDDRFKSRLNKFNTKTDPVFTRLQERVRAPASGASTVNSLKNNHAVITSSTGGSTAKSTPTSGTSTDSNSTRLGNVESSVTKLEKTNTELDDKLKLVEASVNTIEEKSFMPKIEVEALISEQLKPITELDARMKKVETKTTAVEGSCDTKIKNALANYKLDADEDLLKEKKKNDALAVKVQKVEEKLAALSRDVQRVDEARVAAVREISQTETDHYNSLQMKIGEVCQIQREMSVSQTKSEGLVSSAIKVEDKLRPELKRLGEMVEKLSEELKETSKKLEEQIKLKADTTAVQKTTTCPCASKTAEKPWPEKQWCTDEMEKIQNSLKEEILKVKADVTSETVKEKGAWVKKAEELHVGLAQEISDRLEHEGVIATAIESLFAKINSMSGQTFM